MNGSHFKNTRLKFDLCKGIVNMCSTKRGMLFHKNGKGCLTFPGNKYCK